MLGLFITGTDTGVGKTWTTCALIRAARDAGLSVGAWKPVCSGAEFDATGHPRWEDIDALSAALGGQFPSERICSQRFLAPLAPPAAAAAEGRRIDLSSLKADVDWWRERVEFLIVEGAGGWLCPLTGEHTLADLGVELGFPVVIVAANRLGTVNHTLLTAEAITRRGLRLAGVVLNDVAPTADDSAAGNANLIHSHAVIPWLGRVAYDEPRIVTRRGALDGLDLRALAEG